MTSLRVLLTNNTLETPAGSELYLRDVAVELLRRGHRPIAFSTHLGDVAAELRAATIPVLQDLAQLKSPPDIIHGQHHVDAMIAMLHFTRTPAVFVCHGWLPWEEWPPRFSRIYRYLAVDETCRDRMVCEHGLAEEDVEVLLNFVDLRRFTPRSPLPERPRRALVFSHQAREGTDLEAIRQACQQCRLELEVVGAGSGRVAANPHELLQRFDLVFARARSALEAMATGAAVVLYGPSGVGPYVSAAEFDRLRPLNFGIRAIQHACTVEYLTEQIRRYDAVDAAVVSQRVRREAGLEPVVDRLLQIYHEVIAEHAVRGPGDTELAQYEASAYLQQLAPRPRDFYELQRQLNDARMELHDLCEAHKPRDGAKGSAANQAGGLWPNLLRSSKSAFRRAKAVARSVLNL